MEEIGVLHFLKAPKWAALCPTVDLVAVLGDEYLAVYRFTGKVVWSRRVVRDAEIKWNADGASNINVLRLSWDGIELAALNHTKFHCLHGKCILVGASGANLELYEMTHVEQSTSNTTDHAKVLKDIEAEIEHLNACFCKIRDQIVNFGVDQIVQMYTTADQKLFSGFSERVMSLNTRQQESRYHTAHTGISSNLRRLSKGHEAECQEMRRLISDHQEGWDILVLWLRGIQQSVLAEDTARKWQSKCTSTTMSKVLNILQKSTDVWNDQVVWLCNLLKVSFTEPPIRVNLKFITTIEETCVTNVVSDEHYIVTISDCKISRVHLSSLESCRWDTIQGSQILDAHNLLYSKEEDLIRLNFDTCESSTVGHWDFANVPFTVCSARRTILAAVDNRLHALSID
ncbi:hypothetical protein PSACC_03056 [Paramicrosporidium saccamoebae]|uniref:Uncharacterized protein n=1 Tax=Paramicrosporidium saccamoebae TaxID=1246581 RepID=A0A2H9THC6_9FUNG|nr:hypothetical protein PSACC_03056 [Paramicrosporidium saccamoebae]